MKKKKNRLSNLIKWELICLVAVTFLVAGGRKWSGGGVGFGGGGADQMVGGACWFRGRGEHKTDRIRHSRGTGRF